MLGLDFGPTYLAVVFEFLQIITKGNNTERNNEN